jgi:hypothetical protein
VSIFGKIEGFFYKFLSQAFRSIVMKCGVLFAKNDWEIDYYESIEILLKICELRCWFMLNRMTFFKNTGA